MTKSNIAEISNKRRKTNKSSISASLLIKLIEFFVYNWWEIADFWVDSQVLWMCEIFFDFVNMQKIYENFCMLQSL